MHIVDGAGQAIDDRVAQEMAENALLQTQVQINSQRLSAAMASPAVQQQQMSLIRQPQSTMQVMRSSFF